MSAREATILDIRDLIKIEDDDKRSARTFSTYIKLSHMTTHISSDKKAYMIYEWLHPGSRATVHMNGKLRGKAAKDFLYSSFDLYFDDHPELEYVMVVFPRDNVALRYLGATMENVSLVGELKGTEDIMYIMNRGER